MNSIINDIKYNFKTGDTLVKLIYVNVGVFLGLQLLNIIGFFTQIELFDTVFYWLVLPSNPMVLLTRPWTLITHLFIHKDFFHLLFNLLWLYMGGKLFTEYLGEKRLLSVYFLGGIIGGFAYLLFYNISPVFSNISGFCFGASASSLAIFIAIATYTPTLLVQLPLIGSVQIKYLALFFIILDLISIPGFNPGGHIAHLGGAMFGFVFVKQYQNNNDFSNYFYSAYSWVKNLVKSNSKIKIAYSNKQGKTKTDEEYNTIKAEKQKLIDAILDKISKSGYESLTKQEKENLFNASNER